MKSFAFPLDNVLRWRRMQMDLELARTQGLAGKLSRIDAAREVLHEERSSAEREILGSKTLEARELGAIGAFQLRVQKQDTALLEQRRGFEREMAVQREKLVEVQRRVKLLDVLRAKRVTQWSADLGRELEQFAGEAFLGRWQAAKRANVKIAEAEHGRDLE